jgi:cyclopropane-fatty-acyl-phospholipid synthase
MFCCNACRSKSTGLLSGHLSVNTKQNFFLQRKKNCSEKKLQKKNSQWLEKTDINIDKVKAIFDKNYGDEADKQLFNWRLFFIFCSEVFGYNGGNEWHVALFLFKKQIGSSL